MRTGQDLPCVECGTVRYFYPSQLARGYQRCSHACAGVSRRGRTVVFSEAHKRNIAANHHDVGGANNPRWKGGIAPPSQQFHRDNWRLLSRWRRAVFDRDHHACKQCGATTRLEAHHIIGLAETKATAFLVMNGVTLCRSCHKATKNYGHKGAVRQDWGFGSLRRDTTLMHVIPHKWQAYPTVGNYERTDTGVLVIFVSDMGNPSYQSLVGLHEYVEAVLCQAHGISYDTVTAFDLAYEAARTPENLEEPGDDERAPYRAEHCFATGLERRFAEELGVDWNEYERAVMAL